MAAQYCPVGCSVVEGVPYLSSGAWLLPAERGLDLGRSRVFLSGAREAIILLVLTSLRLKEVLRGKCGSGGRERQGAGTSNTVTRTLTRNLRI